MPYDRKRAAEMVLALMYLDVHDGVRAWKGYPWDVLDFLFDAGLITDPARKAKSVLLTEVGLAEATRCFHELLDDASPVAKVSAPRQSRADGLPDVQRARVELLLGPICEPHPDPRVAAEVRRGYRIESGAVVLFESRPAFEKRGVWHERPAAKFRFNPSRSTWQLYSMFRDLKWRTYEPLPESTDLAELVREVLADPTGIFWG